MVKGLHQTKKEGFERTSSNHTGSATDFSAFHYITVFPLLKTALWFTQMVVSEEGWSFIRGRKQCKPKHVSSGICEVVFDQGGLSRGGLL